MFDSRVSGNCGFLAREVLIRSLPSRVQLKLAESSDGPRVVFSAKAKLELHGMAFFVQELIADCDAPVDSEVVQEVFFCPWCTRSCVFLRYATLPPTRRSIGAPCFPSDLFPSTCPF